MIPVYLGGHDMAGNQGGRLAQQVATEIKRAA